jgi:prepilin-type N-terminal cleavage/methylation domain-containing protein
MKALREKVLQGRERKGFTLIELLIVIALATLVIAIFLSYYIYSSKQAVAKSDAANIVDTMRQIREAAQIYVLKNGVEATGLSDLNLSSKPIPPKSAKDPNFTGTFAYEWHTDINVQGSSDNDVTVVLPGVNDDVCKKINDMYTDLGATIPTSLSSDYTYQCYNDGTNNDVVGVIYVH